MPAVPSTLLDPPASIAWLIDHGRELLQSIGDDNSADWGRKLAPWQSELLRQQIGFRKRCRGRFPHPNLWLWTDVSLAQASDYWSANFKAGLFPADAQVVDACCGAGADLVALARRGEVLGIDADPALAALAKDNARAHGLDVEVHVARLSDKLPDKWSSQAAWLSIDPDRRAGGQRTTDAQAFSPTLDQVLHMAQQCAGSIIKLAPSTRTDNRLTALIDATCHRMWLGNQGECRQLLLLTGELRQFSPPYHASHPSVFAGSPIDNSQARTAVLCEPSEGEPPANEAWAGKPPAGDESDKATHHIYQANMLDWAGRSLPPADIGRYVFDLSSTLHAAELQHPWSVEHGLSPISESHGYYTSDTLVSSPWTQAFELITVLAWDDRKIRKWLRGFGAGQVEVKVRGVYPIKLHVDANACQRRYSSADGEPVTLLVTRIGDRLRGIAARRI